MLRQINMSVKVFLLVCLCYFATAIQVNKCKADDAKCIQQSTQEVIPILAKGIPELGVDTLDPLFLKGVDANTNSLKLHFSDVTLKGLRNCEAIKIERDLSKSKIFVKILCNVLLDGQYEMGGKLLRILPVHGNGPFHMKLRNIEVDVDIDVDFVDGKDGKKHLEIKKWKHSFQPKDKPQIKFENLFNGNEVLARAASDLVQNSGNDIIVEIGPPVVNAIVDKIVGSVKQFFMAIPYEELSLD